MELKKDLELVMVDYDENGKKVTLNFLDAENEEIRDVSFNKQSYNQEKQKFEDDPEKEEKVVNKINELFGCGFDDLEAKIGVTKDVYCYEKFNSLYEVDMVDKFPMEMKGDIINTEIKEIIVDNIGIRIRYDWDGKTYESKMMYADYIESMKKFLTNPNKKKKQIAKFKEKFGVDVEDKDQLIGHHIMVEVKVAGGKFPYGDIKKLPKKA